MTDKPQRWIRQGDIWSAEVPRPDGLGLTGRPVVILSNNRFNSTLEDVLAIPLTSKLPSARIQFAYIIEDWAETGLIRKSAIKPQVVAINKLLLTARLGRLSDATFAELQRHIATWF